MKCVLLLLALAAMVAAEPHYYKTENDNVDVDAIIANVPLFQSFMDCYLDRVPCNSLAESYKKYITVSVVGACDICSVQMKKNYAKFLWGLKKVLPQEYINFRQKYDPSDMYFDRLEAALANYLQIKSTESPTNN